MRIERALGDAFARVDHAAFGHLESGAVGNDVDPLFFSADAHFGLVVGTRLDGDDGAVRFADLRDTLRFTGFEKFFDSRKTLGDVVARDGYAAGMERSHGQLRTGFADGLRGDDADGFADVHVRTGRQVAAVAGCADAGLALAGHDRTDLDGLDAGLFDGFGLGLPDLFAALDDHFAGGRIDDVLERRSAHDAQAQRFDDFLAVREGSDFDAFVGAAVVLADDHVVGYVDETAGQVTGVRGTQSGISQTLSGAVGGDEVLHDRQAFAEVGGDGDLDGLTGSVAHQAAHAADLADLVLGTTGAGVCHDEQVVLCLQGVHQSVRDVVRGLVPDLDDVLVALVVAHEAASVERFVLVDLLLSRVDDLLLVLGHDHVSDGDGDRSPGGILEACALDVVQHLRGLRIAVGAEALVDDAGEVLLAAQEADLEGVRVFVSVDEAQILRDLLVEDEASDGGFHQAAFLIFGSQIHAHLDLRVDTHGAGLVGHEHFGVVGEDLAVALFGHALEAVRAVLFLVLELVDAFDQLAVLILLGAYAGMGQVVGTEDHVLGRRRDRGTVLRRQDIVDGHHQEPCFGLRLYGQRHVDRHLVAVEVRVVSGAHQRVQADGLAFDQHGFEGLDAQSVQRRGAVQEHGVILDDVVQNVPDFRADLFDHSLGALDVMREASEHELLHDEGLEELQRHLLGKTALIELQVGAYDDNGTSGVVDALAQQVLTESALLALEHVGQGLQGSAAGTRDRTASAAVVDQGVDGFLQHALLVAHDDVGRAEFEQSLQTVVSVDDPSVQVV